MPTKITVNASYGGEVYLSSIKKVLKAGQSVIVEDSAAGSDEIKKLISKKIIQVSSPDEPEQTYDKLALNPNEKFKVKNLSGRNLSVQGIKEMMVPNGAIFIDYETLLSGFIGVMIKSGMAEVSDVNGNQVVLDEASGFKKVAPEAEEVELPELEVGEEEAEIEDIEGVVEDVVLSEKALSEEEVKELYDGKISLKTAADAKAQTGNQEADELMTKDEFGDTVIDPLLKDKEKKTSYVWDFEAKSAKEGKPVFEYEGEDSIPDDGSAFIMPNKKLSIKSKNDVADALNANKPKKESIKKAASEEVEEKPVAKKKTTKKKTKKKTTKKKSTKKKTTKKKTKKKTSKKRKVSQKKGIDKVVDKIQKKKLSIKAVGQEKQEVPAEQIGDDEVVIHNQNESFFVDQTQEAERIAKHPILRNKNNEDVE